MFDGGAEIAEPTVSLVVRGGRAVTPHGIVRADIAVADGTIARLAEEIAPPPGATVVDARGAFVIPGVIDAHDHPVYGDRLATMSRSAVAGGITTLLSFFAAMPDRATPMDQLCRFIDEGVGTSLVDFGVHLERGRHEAVPAR